MTGASAAQKPLGEVENLLKRGSHRLLLKNSNDRLVSVVGWGQLIPPLIVTEYWHDHEIYSAMYLTLEEARREEGFDLSLFVLVERDEEPDGERRGTV